MDRTKMDDFWSMQKDLGEPKTSEDLNEIEFRKLWNLEHPKLAYNSRDLDSEDDNSSIVFPSRTTNQSGISEDRKKVYGNGAILVKKRVIKVVVWVPWKKVSIIELR